MPRRRHAGWQPPSDDSHLPFMVKCSRDHKSAKLLHRGIVVAGEDGTVSVEWVEHGRLGVPYLGELNPDGDRKVALRCAACRLDRQMPVSLLVRALNGLAAADMKDRLGRVVLDIACVPR